MYNSKLSDAEESISGIHSLALVCMMCAIDESLDAVGNETLADIFKVIVDLSGNAKDIIMAEQEAAL